MDLFGYTKMLALSWRQPFGSAMLLEKIETRTWDTNHRGQVLICTSRLPYSDSELKAICGDVQYDRLLATIKGTPETIGLNGFAIAVGELVSSRVMKPSDEDRTFVQYRPNLFCHIYKNVRPIQPIPWTGSVGWLKLNQDFIKSIQYLEPSQTNL
jgi:hypothetical protein